MWFEKSLDKSYFEANICESDNTMVCKGKKLYHDLEKARNIGQPYWLPAVDINLEYFSNRVFLVLQELLTTQLASYVFTSRREKICLLRERHGLWC